MDVAVRQRLQQIIEAGKGRLVAFRVQGERSFLGGNGESHLLQDVPLIHPLGHDVPGHAMLSFLVEQSPGGDIQPRVVGQRSVVEVDRASARQRENRRRYYREIRHAEEVIERRKCELRRQVASRRDA